METEMTEIQNTSTGFTKKCNAFFKRNYALFFAPVIVLCLYFFGLWQYGVYPFGDKYTAASYDLSAQICPFIEHLFDVFDGKSTLTYSYAIVGGADVTGTFLYFFISPFSFLFLLFGDGRVAHASSIVMACKLATIAVAGAWFAKKQFKGIPDYLCIAVGCVYAYCGYTFVANTYINWMDFLIYVPFATGAFVRFVRTGKFLRFSLLVACCIYTCFSIACFSMFTVFPSLVAYALLCVKKEERNKFIANVCLSFVVAVLIALPVLLPALGAYTNSARGGKLFENFWYGFTVSKETGLPADFDKKQFVDTFSGALYAKWSYILSDTVFIALTLVWFCKKGLKDPFAKFMLVAGVFTLLPTIVDEAMNLMNMGSYMSYALRFGFLNALYFLGGACLALENLCYKTGCTYDGKKLFKAPNGDTKNRRLPAYSENKKAYLWAGLTIVIALAVFVFLFWFTSYGNYRKFLALFTDNQENIDALGSIPGRFAHSLGGLEAIVICFALVTVFTLIGCYFVSTKRISARLLSFTLIAVLAVQVAFYNGLLVLGNRSQQHEPLKVYETLCQELDTRTDGYYRVKDYDDELTANAPFTTGSNSFSVFSSVIDEDNFAVYQLFGYAGNGKNTFKSAHNENKYNRGDAFGDSFIGYKYYIVPSDKRAGIEEKSYLQKVMTTDEQGNEVQLSAGDFYVYENTAVFPLGYRVSAGDFRFVAPNTSNSTYRKENQQALYQFLRGEKLEEFTGQRLVTEGITKELSEYLWSKAADVEVGAGKITASVTAEAGECLLLNFVASEGYAVTVNGKRANLIDNDLKFLAVELETGGNTVEFVYHSPYINYALIGISGAVVGLCLVAFVVKKTRLTEKCAPVLAWAGIGLATAVVAFFMVYPTGAFIVKVVEYLRVLWV